MRPRWYVVLVAFTLAFPATVNAQRGMQIFQNGIYPPNAQDVAAAIRAGCPRDYFKVTCRQFGASIVAAHPQVDLPRSVSDSVYNRALADFVSQLQIRRCRDVAPGVRRLSRAVSTTVGWDFRQERQYESDEMCLIAQGLGDRVIMSMTCGNVDAGPVRLAQPQQEVRRPAPAQTEPPPPPVREREPMVVQRGELLPPAYIDTVAKRLQIVDTLHIQHHGEIELVETQKCRKGCDDGGWSPLTKVGIGLAVVVVGGLAVHALTGDGGDETNVIVNNNPPPTDPTKRPRPDGSNLLRIPFRIPIF